MSKKLLCGFVCIVVLCVIAGCNTKDRKDNDPTAPGDDATELFRVTYVENGMFQLDFNMSAEYFACTDGTPAVAGFNGDWTPVPLAAIGDNWYRVTLALNQGHHQFTPLFGTSCWMKGEALFLENGNWYCGGVSFEGTVVGEEMKPCNG